MIVVAAGNGVRLAAGTPKAFAPLCGEPLLAHALRGVLVCAEIAHVIVVAPASHLHEARGIAGVDQRVEDVAGGADRAASVKAGLGALHPDDGIVLVHDAARPLAPAALFTRVIHAVRAGHPAVVPGLAVPDTIKVVDADGRVQATPDRESLRAVQTPQGFLREVLEHAHAEGTGSTDDAGLVERVGGHVLVVDGDPRAFKVTSALDLAVAAALMQDGSHDN